MFLRHPRQNKILRVTKSNTWIRNRVDPKSRLSAVYVEWGGLFCLGSLGAASQGLHTEISISCRLRLWSEHLYCLRDGLVATKRGILATRLQPMMMKDDAGWMNGLEWKPWQDYKTKLTAFL